VIRFHPSINILSYPFQIENNFYLSNATTNRIFTRSDRCQTPTNFINYLQIHQRRSLPNSCLLCEGLLLVQIVLHHQRLVCIFSRFSHMVWRWLRWHLRNSSLIQVVKYSYHHFMKSRIEKIVHSKYEG